MKVIAILLSIIFLSSCCSSKNESISNNKSNIETNNLKNGYGPRAIIYKTKRNYISNVSVILTPDKKSIVTYPDPTDVNKENNFLKATELINGFLLDNKGINQDVAFLSISLEDYSKLQTTPSISELFNLIIDDDPLLEMFDCGNKSNFKNIKEDLINIISKNEFNKCKKIK